MGTDPRATSIRDCDRKVALRRLLRERYDWPDPPRRKQAAHDTQVRADLEARLSR